MWCSLFTVFHRISHQTSAVVKNSVFAANPLVAAVLRENVRIRGGRALIDLWPHRPSLLADVHAFGPVLSVSRNDQAVLGRAGPYPQVFSAPCGHCGGSPDGSMEFYFSRWQRAFASVEEQPGGWLYALEFQGKWGDTLHKICLAPESDFGAFLGWVERNQAGDPIPGEATSGRPSCLNSGESQTVPYEGISLQPGVMHDLLHGLIEEEICAQFVVGNEGMVQGADMRPTALRENSQWVFLSQEDCGLHLRLSRVAEVRLHRVLWPDCSHWVLKVHEPEGHLICVLAPPRGQPAGDWDPFLLEVTAAHHINRP